MELTREELESYLKSSKLKYSYMSKDETNKIGYTIRTGSDCYKFFKNPLLEEPCENYFQLELGIIGSVSNRNLLKQTFLTMEKFKEINKIKFVDENFESRVGLVLMTPYIRINTKKLTESNMYIILAKIAASLAHLHKCGIIHGNLKLENVLIDTNFEVYVCDYGLNPFLSIEPYKVDLEYGKSSLFTSLSILDGSPCSFESDLDAFIILMYLFCKSFSKADLPKNEYSNTIIRTNNTISFESEGPFFSNLEDFIEKRRKSSSFDFEAILTKIEKLYSDICKTSFKYNHTLEPKNKQFLFLSELRIYQNNPENVYRYGLLFVEEDQDVDINPEMAFYYIKQAADRNLTLAKLHYAESLIYGKLNGFRVRGLEKNLEKALFVLINLETNISRLGDKNNFVIKARSLILRIYSELQDSSRFQEYAKLLTNVNSLDCVTQYLVTRNDKLCKKAILNGSIEALNSFAIESKNIECIVQSIARGSKELIPLFINEYLLKNCKQAVQSYKDTSKT